MSAPTDSAPAIAVWEDTANRGVFLCFDHDSRDDAIETFAARWPKDGPFGMVVRSIELVGRGHPARCDHPAHNG